MQTSRDPGMLLNIFQKGRILVAGTRQDKCQQQVYAERIQQGWRKQALYDTACRPGCNYSESIGQSILAPSFVASRTQDVTRCPYLLGQSLQQCPTCACHLSASNFCPCPNPVSHIALLIHLVMQVQAAGGFCAFMQCGMSHGCSVVGAAVKSVRQQMSYWCHACSANLQSTIWNTVWEKQ